MIVGNISLIVLIIIAAIRDIPAVKDMVKGVFQPMSDITEKKVVMLALCGLVAGTVLSVPTRPGHHPIMIQACTSWH